MTIKIGIASNHMIHPTQTLDTNYFDYIQKDYVDAIRKAGGLPVVLPLGDPSDAEDYIALVDGLLLAGGQGLSPVLYDTEPIREMAESDIYRDRFEIALVKAAVRAHKPILGICRGEQVINVALGGTLYQDIYVQMDATEKHNQLPTSWEIPTQHVTTTADSFLDKLMGHRFLVNTFHHQAIHDLGKGLTAVAESDDHVIEAIESDDGNVFAVQFHPERMFKTTPAFISIFDHLIERAH